MADTYKVSQVTPGEPFDYTPPGSPPIRLVPYELLLDGPDAPLQEVTLNQVPDTPAPTVGQELFGNLSQGSRGWRFKKENPNFPSGVSGGGSNGQGRTDATGVSIERQVAFKEAAETLRPHFTDMADDVYASELKRLTDLGHAAITGA